MLQLPKIGHNQIKKTSILSPSSASQPFPIKKSILINFQEGQSPKAKRTLKKSKLSEIGQSNAEKEMRIWNLVKKLDAKDQKINFPSEFTMNTKKNQKKVSKFPEKTLQELKPAIPVPIDIAKHVSKKQSKT